MSHSARSIDDPLSGAALSYFLPRLGSQVAALRASIPIAGAFRRLHRAGSMARTDSLAHAANGADFTFLYAPRLSDRPKD